jgi:hypothetical protein
MRIVNAFGGQRTEEARYLTSISHLFDISIRESKARSAFYAGIGQLVLHLVL